MNIRVPEELQLGSATSDRPMDVLVLEPVLRRRRRRRRVGRGCQSVEELSGDRVSDKDDPPVGHAGRDELWRVLVGHAACREGKGRPKGEEVRRAAEDAARTREGREERTFGLPDLEVVVHPLARVDEGLAVETVVPVCRKATARREHSRRRDARRASFDPDKGRERTNGKIPDRSGQEGDENCERAGVLRPVWVEGRLARCRLSGGRHGERRRDGRARQCRGTGLRPAKEQPGYPWAKGEVGASLARVQERDPMI